jgi:hypothetical protein
VVKSWPAEPIIYAAIVAGLLLFRLFPERRKPARRRAPPQRSDLGAA